MIDLLALILIGAAVCVLEWLWKRGAERAMERLSAHDSRYGADPDESLRDVLRICLRGKGDTP